MKIEAKLIEKVSKKTGNVFTALELTFPNGYKKLVFLETAEMFMLSQISQ